MAAFILRHCIIKTIAKKIAWLKLSSPIFLIVVNIILVLVH